MKIYTSTGDFGKTSLFSGERLKKNDVRVDAYGSVDELCSVIGVIVAALPVCGEKRKLINNLQEVQCDLFAIGALMVTLPDSPNSTKLNQVDKRRIDWLEGRIDSLQDELSELHAFILPGGHMTAAWSQVARSVCRRAERCIISLADEEGGEQFEEVLMYINRLSDFFFVLARYCNKIFDVAEITWGGTAGTQTNNATIHRVAVTARKWLSQHTFELRLMKPAGFSFRAGQKILCSSNNEKREYSLVSSPLEDDLAICVRRVRGGGFSPYLAEVAVGEEISISNGFGFFTHQKGNNIFVATGTGVAPFVAFAKSGVRDFLLLHGVSSAKELYYRELFTSAAKSYIPCLSSDSRCGYGRAVYSGRVTGYLEERLVPGTYNFYLCGNGAMIRDAVQIIDRKFPESRTFVETFFSRE